ncbi:hypothetical protein DSO57_1003434 [Entomophthora muscae]|uniref:Uncharacterized protein n=1 Tax=Entomophthora muscae TaxID=34485 RepID=A0ACC2UJ41_9FUNG|nr:hypothetical protein DSO57_1003434 [Entomophthora muscae]
MLNSAITKFNSLLRPGCTRTLKNDLNGICQTKNVRHLKTRFQARSFSISRMVLNDASKGSGGSDQGLFSSQKIKEFKSHPMYAEILKHPDLLQELKITLDMMKVSNSKSSAPSFAQAIKLLADPAIRKQLDKLEKMFEEKKIKIDRSLLKAFMS